MDLKKDIVILGAGLTGLTLGFYLKKAGKDFLIIEKEEKTGGVIKTVSSDGFIFETGPNTGVLSNTEIVELFDDLAGSCTLEKGDPAANKRFILKNGKWTALPSGLISGISTPLFSFGDKLRILGEPFRKPGTNPDESVASLVRRRLGKSFLDYAVNPFISGIYAGDPEKLITRFALPKLYALEQNYGSFIKGAMAKAREKKSDREKKATKEVFAVKGGLGNLVGALAEKIGSENILTGFNTTVVSRAGKEFTVTTGNNSGKVIQVNAKKVVSTAGGYSLPSVLPFVNTNDLGKILKLEYAKVVQVSAGYRKWNGMVLDAFGGLVPEKEKRKILGILFPSAIFKGRAPEGGAMLSVFIGGTRNPSLIEKGDSELIEIAVTEINETLHSSGQPDMAVVSRYIHAIPQYGIDSGERLAAIGRIESDNPGLILAGNIRDGIGMADRVKQARMLAEQLNEPHPSVPLSRGERGKTRPV